MTLRLQNMMLAILLALTTLFVGLGTMGQNPMSGGYQLFERVVSGISADNSLTALGNFSAGPETAPECCNVPNRVATGNSSVDDFVNTRTGGNPRADVDGEAGNPVGPQGRVFNAQELDDFAPTIAQRNPTRLSDGSLIDNQGFVYTRNANGSVTSRVASQDQLAQSGQRLDFDNISTANARQPATPRNHNEQLAFDYVRANPQTATTQGRITRINSNDARFSANGFEKFHQSVPGPNGRNISIHYQYNPTSGRVVDLKVTSPISNSQ